METKSELQDWLKFFLDIDLPDQIVDTEYSTSSPLDMVWTVYDAAFNNGDTNFLFYANRDGGKTFCAATIEFLLLMHDRRSVVHVGAIEKQAERCYTYFQKIFTNEHFKDFIDRMIMKMTYVKDRGTFEILPCTIASVNGPHTPLVVRDEIDTVMDLQAYKDIMGIPTQMPDGRPPIKVGISTRKSQFGLVQQEIEEASKTGLRIYNWNILEVTERCPDSRSGAERIPIYVNINELEYLIEKDFQKLADKDKAKFKKYLGYQGCLHNCKMFAACRGLLKDQRSTSKYLRKLDLTQQQLFETSREWAIAQHLCLKPSLEGIVYANFSKELSCKSYKQIAELFLKQPIDKEVTYQDLVKIFEAHGLRAYMGVDWGYTNPTVALLMYIDRQENIYVIKEYAVTRTDYHEIALYLQTNWEPAHKWEMVYPDIEDPSSIKMLRKPQRPELNGFPCAGAIKESDSGITTTVNKEVKGGIETVRRYIKVPGTQDTKFFIHHSCQQTIYEFGKYHYKTDKFGNVTADDPVDEDNHGLSALRYVIHSKFGRKEADVVLDLGEEISNSPALSIAPSPVQLAQHAGLTGFVDNSHEYEELKKKADRINNLNELPKHMGLDMDLEDDGDDDSEDGFSFEF